MAKVKKSVANSSKTGMSNKQGFLAEPAKAGVFNSCKASTDGKKK